MTGEPSWIELGVRDADAARAFYGALLGWTPSGTTGPGQVTTSTLDIGIHDGDPSGLFEVFFTVAELDGSLAQVAALGGTVRGDNTSPGFGRWAECEDDQGVRYRAATAWRPDSVAPLLRSAPTPVASRRCARRPRFAPRRAAAEPAEPSLAGQTGAPGGANRQSALPRGPPATACPASPRSRGRD